MSNKPFNQLNELDQKLRKAFPVGMDTPNIRVSIELLNGFELFNTRPYHNYETWSDGYRATDKVSGMVFEAEDLDDAINGLIKKVNELPKTVSY